jgi:hypothetical protein
MATASLRAILAGKTIEGKGRRLAALVKDAVNFAPM